MSFSEEVKQELIGKLPSSRHCQLSAAVALLHHCGLVQEIEGEPVLYLRTDRREQAQKLFTILRKTLRIERDFSREEEKLRVRGRIYFRAGIASQDMRRILTALEETRNSTGAEPAGFNGKICCKRTYLRETFLCIGSVSDPKKGYHLEFDCASEEQTFFLRKLMESFDIHAKTLKRKRYQVVYIKEGEEIAALLNVMEAHVSLMAFENMRIYRDMRNAVNRKVNCEAANISKTARTAAIQVEKIRQLEERGRLKSLEEGLREAAEARLRYPEASLKNLAALMDPPIGKSGMNHRLQKLMMLAEENAENGEDADKGLPRIIEQKKGLEGEDE